MRKLIYTLLIGSLWIITNNISAQPWSSLLPKQKVESGKLTFFDYQNAFNNYWTPKNVVDGYYMLNGDKVKAGGWKQFKRWEWYWENRVNPITGAFPNTSAYEEYKKNITTAAGVRSPSGQWISMGPTTSPGGYAGLGRINCVGFNPSDNDIIYTGAAAGGIWKSTDGGASWIPQGDDLDAIGISGIVVITTSGDDEIFVATGDKDHSDTYSVGVVKSTDGGTTWQNTGLTFTAGQKRLIYRLLLDPIDDNIMYAATNVGVYKTTDAGVTWNVIVNNQFKDMEFKPGNADIIYGSTNDGEVYKSTDGGANWSVTISTGAKRTELAVSPDNPNVVYALIANTNSGLFGIYKSNDSGTNFSAVYNGINLLGWDCSGGDSGGQAWYDLCIASDPNNADVVYIGGVNNWKSSNGGITWSINNHWSSNCGGTATTVHADKHNLAFQNSTSTLFECNDGGLYNTTDNGSTWNYITDGMAISQMYRLGVAQTTPDDVITGLQDNGTKSYSSNTWEDVIGGDGMACLIDHSDENIQYGSIYYGSIYRTTDHWVNSTNISNGLSGNAAWVTPYVQDPNNSNTLYVGYQDVWKSTNKGDSWSQISNWGGNTLRSIAVAPSNSNYIYAATLQILYTTPDGGTTWNDITGSLPVGASNITYISVKNTDPLTVWVSMGEFNGNGVFESTDGGTSWTNISAGLPNLPVSCVIQNRQNTSQVELYAATDVGIYIKLDGVNWAQYSTNLPNVVVDELAIYYDDVTPANTKIRAATFGRGLWQSDVYSPTATLSADFYANNVNLQLNDFATFTDISTGTPTSWEWTFDGGTPPNYSGQNPPAIQYDTAGTWGVTLIVANAIDTDTTTKADYITVTDCNIVTFPFIEDFENGGIIPTCWSQEYISGGNVDWQFITGNGGSHPATAHSGTYNACLKDQSSNDDKTMLITPILNLSSFTSAKLVFWHTQELWTPDQDELKVYYKVAADSTWVLLESYTNSIVTWTKDSIDLVSIDSTYYIGFEGNAKYGYGVCIDDVEVSGITDVITADFEGDTLSGNFPLLVNFTDLSTGNINTWDWDFGDGDTSDIQNPSHTYSNAGSYDVSLTVSGSAGSDTEIKIGYINVTYPAPVADFVGDPVNGEAPLLVSFTDLSVDSVNTWMWDFGDGGSSAEQNPNYTYADTGSYSVQLIVSGPGGTDTLVKADYVHVNYAAPVADFVGDPLNGEAPLLVNFTDLSTGNVDTWSWNFGDGDSSNNQNPVHQYVISGSFTVSLTAIGPGGNDTETKTNYVLIPVGINANYTEAILVYPNPVINILNIVFPDAKRRTIILKNMDGKQILEQKTDKKVIALSMNKLASGIYSLLIKDNGKVVSYTKIIKK